LKVVVCISAEAHIFWQGWMVSNQTFKDEELEKVDVQEIKEILSLISDGIQAP